MRIRNLAGVAAALMLSLSLQGQADAKVLVSDAADGYNVAAEGVALAATVESVDLTLGSGWNMVSLPVTPTDANFQTLFPDAISAFEFAGSYQQVTTLSTCTGYWVNLGSGSTYTLTGGPISQCDQSLGASWSMVGAPIGGAAFDDIIANPSGSITSIFEFSGSYQQITAGGMLSEGGGFWINMSQAAQVTMNSATGGTPAAKRIGSALPSLAALQDASKLVVSGAGAEQTVYLGVASDAVVALPPTPPAGVLDVRAQVSGVATDRIPAVAEQRDYQVRLQGSDLTLRWDVNPAEASQWQLLIDGRPQSLTGNGQLSLGDTPKDMVLRYTPLPTQFDLKANYPNPFNPSTTIQYEIANATDVSLTIYDVIGQKIRTLVNGTQTAGSYSAVWDGRNEFGQQVANGLYFYELQAGDFHSMRKMMLTK